jgi:hypothetical protein
MTFAPIQPKANLPRSDDRAVFTEKCNGVFDLMLDYASQKLKWAAELRTSSMRGADIAGVRSRPLKSCITSRVNLGVQTERIRNQLISRYNWHFGADTPSATIPSRTALSHDFCYEKMRGICSILRRTSAPSSWASSHNRSLERRILWSSVLSLGDTVSRSPLKQMPFEASADVEFESNSLDRHFNNLSD